PQSPRRPLEAGPHGSGLVLRPASAAGGRRALERWVKQVRTPPNLPHSPPTPCRTPTRPLGGDPSAFVRPQTCPTHRPARAVRRHARWAVTQALSYAPNPAPLTADPVPYADT